MTIRLFLILSVAANSFATDVLFTFTDNTSHPQPGAALKLTAPSALNGTNITLISPVARSLDANGTAIVSNVTPSVVYLAEVGYPMREITRNYFVFPATNGLIDAYQYLVAPTNSPGPGSMAYSMVASDARYALSGAAGGGVTNNQYLPGTPVGNGAGFTNISAASIVYGPSISSFGNNQNVVEIGSTVNSTVLTWALSGTAPTSQTINQGIGTVAVGTLTATDSSAYTSSRTYTLTVANANGSATASTSVSFESKNFWGASANSSLTDGQIIALSSGFNTGRQMTQSITASAQYIYVAYPAAYGAANFNVNGLPNTAWNLVTRAFANASGYSASYDIYQSQNLLTGTYTIGVQ